MTLNGKKLNFLGDSITEGVGVSEEAKTFWGLIASREGAICRGYGIGGTRIARQTAPSDEPRWDLDFCSRVADMDADADVVVVFGGTNDFGHGDAPMGTMADRTPDTFYGAMHTLCTALIERYTDATVMFMTPLHRTSEDEPQKGLVLADYVAVIREVTQFYSLPVLDLFAAGGMQPRVPVVQERFMPDGLHPNDAGHEIIAAKLTAFLKAM